jgi:hypothetical protein
MSRFSFRSGKGVALLSFIGVALPYGCVASSDENFFENQRCTLGEEACGCRPDKTCNGTLACYSNLCVLPTGTGAPKESGATGGSGGSSGDDGKGEAGREDTPGAGGDASAGAPGAGGESGAAPSENLVENGDFESDEEYWTLEPPKATRTISDGALCITVGTGESVLLGWPREGSQAFELSAGHGYTFSYVAWSSGPLAISLSSKIGHAVPPYTTHFVTSVELESEPSTHSHDFHVAVSDDAAGLAFSITGAQGKGSATVCFDDVSVVKNP